MSNRLLLALCAGLLLVLTSCSTDRSMPALIESVSVAESIIGPEAAYAAFGSELAALAPKAKLTVAERDDALTAVRSGAVRAALVPRIGTASFDGLAVTDVAVQPVALLVPFTFPVEEVSAEQARALATGQVTSWRDLGGPSATVQVMITDPEIVSLVFGQPAAGQRGEGGTVRHGQVLLAPGASAGPAAKALRVNGASPHEPGYPFTVLWSIVGRNDDARVAALGQALAARARERDQDVAVLDAVGDIMLGRTVGRTIEMNGPRYPFEAVEPLLAGSDLRIGNLELPLTSRGQPARKDYVFRAPPSVAAGLSAAGFGLLTLANNHMLDYGIEGLLDTIDTLDRAGVGHVGAGRTVEEAHEPVILTVNGLRLAFLSYVNTPNDGRSGWVAESMRAGPTTPGVAWGTPDVVARDVAAARAHADLVIVAIHAGWEYTPTPNPVQRGLGYAAVEAGAALVLGAHPHVLQGIEFYHNVPIVYSLGNFVFDIDDDDRRQPGMPSLLTAVIRLRLNRQGVQSIEVRPAVIDQRDGRPIPVTGAAARPVYDRIYSLTDTLNAGR
jgi:poly-gamma-glutamate capsule biosynthesis protein CapA/YwtB (metallophosphatase superfamily)